uniref:AT-rich interactive domain 4A n=1 Tax=Oreochromis niloticus TaxID=8128 RepID=I3JYB7_ORENI
MFVLAFQAADEPAYLTVGTDVSAKYRGAFCEAKIKTVKRMVKVKVTLKGESTSQVVQDDQVKGSLRVGSTVEVKTSEGICSEAVISKLTDASLYTVVFDDGDEKTLRRTSLCLKGERHFAESETLDQLPLTNPEHFGTPVIGKKSNRGGRRSSQAVADEDNESSSSEDEDDDRRRLNDELLGQVCSIENDEESSTWFLALVVSPSCNDELVVKKDQCLVRSFCNGVEGAQMFLSSKEIPDLWKMDMSQILDSSSSEDEDNEEEKESEEEQDDEEEKKRKRIKEESLVLSGTPINKPPVLGYKDLNLFKLYRLVYHLGGCHKIESGTVWKQVYIDLGIPVLNSAASYNVKTAYKKYLYGFEEYCRSAAITFRTIHHNNPRPPATPASQKAAGAALTESSTPTVKVETVVDKQEEVESESESEKEDVKERQSSPRGRRRCVGSRVKAERETSSKLDKRGPGEGENREEQQREVRRRSNRRNDDSERGSDDDEEDEDDEEEEEGERRRGDRSENEEDGDTVTGTKVRVKYGRGKTQKIYEAHIKKTDNDNGEQFYLVHYYGWNVRYDEWVKADRIIWPVEKATKKRQKKKVKVRCHEEAEEMEEEAEERSSVALKRKAGDQKTAEKKPRPDRRQEETTKMVAGASPKALPLPLHSEKSSEGVVIAEEQPHPAEEPQKEEPAYTEELEPQIDPESLVCHEVDLDDTDEKEKPIPSLDHHFPIVNESQQAPPPLPHLIHSSLPSPHTPHFPQPQARPFLPEVTPIEVHQLRKCDTEEEGCVVKGEQERDSSPGFDGSASSSSTSLSLQENKDRGQKRLTDCNSSPSAKKQKRNQKRPQTPGRVEKNGAGQFWFCTILNNFKLLDLFFFLKSRFNLICVHFDFSSDELDSMSSTERISFLQEKLQEIRKYYMTLKSEVASIDRRRKRLKKKEREGRRGPAGKC